MFTFTLKKCRMALTGGFFFVPLKDMFWAFVGCANFHCMEGGIDFALFENMLEEKMSAFMGEFAEQTIAEVEEQIVLQMKDFIEWLRQQGNFDPPSWTWRCTSQTDAT